MQTVINLSLFIFKNLTILNIEILYPHHDSSRIRREITEYSQSTLIINFRINLKLCAGSTMANNFRSLMFKFSLKKFYQSTSGTTNFNLLLGR